MDVLVASELCGLSAQLNAILAEKRQEPLNSFAAFKFAFFFHIRYRVLFVRANGKYLVVPLKRRNYLNNSIIYESSSLH